MSTVDVVIVNWNTGGYLDECLRSVFEHTAADVLGRVVVVDNASTDDSLARAGVRLARPEVVVVRNDDNRGFAAACNQGAALATAPLVLFLNPDTTLVGDAIGAAVDFLDAPAGRPVGICGARMVDADGRPTISGGPLPTPRLVLGQVSGLSRVAPRLFPSKRVGDLGHTGPVAHVIGAFFVVRRHLFDALGGFDEGFFLYYEEVDLSARARDLGWLSYQVAGAVVRHVGNVSSDQVRASRLAWSLTSRRRYALRHWSRRAVAALTVITWCVELPARALAETMARRRLPTETLRGYCAYVAAIRRAEPGRRVVQSPSRSRRSS